MDAPKLTGKKPRWEVFCVLPPMPGDRPGRKPRVRRFTVEAFTRQGATTTTLNYMVQNYGPEVRHQRTKRVDA